jgi:hypothetical protein
MQKYCLRRCKVGNQPLLLAFKSPAFELEAPIYFRGRNEEEFRILNYSAATVEAALAIEVSEW